MLFVQLIINEIVIKILSANAMTDNQVMPCRVGRQSVQNDRKDSKFVFKCLRVKSMLIYNVAAELIYSIAALKKTTALIAHYFENGAQERFYVIAGEGQLPQTLALPPNVT